MLRKKDVDKILISMLRSHRGVSDLLFTPGRPFQVEAHGNLTSVEMTPVIENLTPYQTEMLTIGLLGGDRKLFETLVKSGSADCAYEVPGEARFRVNVFQQRKQMGGVLRKLETKILTLEDLKLPDIFKEMAAEKNGLILVTGSTGSGKSTTLAALLNEMNETRAIHILTIEDPIEYVHPHKKATFNQRELGTDFSTFHASLRAALRQAPKVILIGEMRDRETVDIGLAAASTGHLVLSTLHSIDAGQTINRIIGMFDKEEEPQIRARLIECLRYVVNQRLLPKEGGGRVAAQEIMGMNLRVKEVLSAGESEGKTYYEITAASRNRGWQTHDQCISELFFAGTISEETALSYASRRPIMMRLIDTHKQEKGIEEIGALKLNLDTTAKEANDLIKSTWPGAGTKFPIYKEFGNDARMIVYEPNVEVQNNQIRLVFSLKVQGVCPGVLAQNPKGELKVSAQSKGSNEIQVPYNGLVIETIRIQDSEMTKSLKPLFEELLPKELQLANKGFIPVKRKTLDRLAEIGRTQHVLALRALRDKASDPNEVNAIEETIKVIEARK